MFQIVMSALLALVAGKPSAPWALSAPALVPQTYVTSYSAPAVANVGSIVSHVPTAVSSQSSSVVHSTGAVVTPIVTPVHKTVIAAPAVPILSHAAPLAYSPYSLGAYSAWNQPIVHSWWRVRMLSNKRIACHRKTNDTLFDWNICKNDFLKKCDCRKRTPYWIEQKELINVYSKTTSHIF